MEENIAEQDIHHRKSAAQLHQGYLKEHEGHEEMHFTMMMIFFVAIFCVQLFLVFWKTRYTRSYQVLSLLAVWLIPVYYCIKLVFWRMFTCWLIFTAISMFILKKASAKPLNPDTPSKTSVQMVFASASSQSHAGIARLLHHLDAVPLTRQ